VAESVSSAVAVELIGNVGEEHVGQRPVSLSEGSNSEVCPRNITIVVRERFYAITLQSLLQFLSRLSIRNAKTL
jgi:hypothetical protein